MAEAKFEFKIYFISGPGPHRKFFFLKTISIQDRQKDVTKAQKLKIGVAGLQLRALDKLELVSTDNVRILAHAISTERQASFRIPLLSARPQWNI